MADDEIQLLRPEGRLSQSPSTRGLGMWRRHSIENRSIQRALEDELLIRLLSRQPVDMIKQMLGFAPGYDGTLITNVVTVRDWENVFVIT